MRPRHRRKSDGQQHATALTSPVKVLLLQGANMRALGHRQPELYGRTTARELDTLLRRHARAIEQAGLGGVAWAGDGIAAR